MEFKGANRIPVDGAINLVPENLKPERLDSSLFEDASLSTLYEIDLHAPSATTRP